MTPEQRYQLDTFGFLHLRGALAPAELAAAQAAAARYMRRAAEAPASLEEPFGQGGNPGTPWSGDDPRRFPFGFAFDKVRAPTHPTQSGEQGSRARQQRLRPPATRSAVR
jgi:hypothetical protein